MGYGTIKNPDGTTPAPVGSGTAGNLGTQPSTLNEPPLREEGKSPYPNIYNPDAYELGGHPGGAQADVDRDRGMAAAAEGRQGPQINSGQINADRSLESSGRNDQGYGLQSLRGILDGTGGPTVAEMQRRQGQANANQLATSTGAGTRGGGANLAAGSRLTGEQQGQIQANATGQAGLLHAQEYAAAQAQYSNAANAQRAQDLQRQGLSAQQAQSQAQLEAQQRGLNDTRSMGMEGLGQSSEFAQQNAQMAQEQENSGVYTGDVNRQLQQNLADKAASTANTDAAIGMAGSLIKAGGTGSDVRIKTNIGDGAAAVHRMLDKLHTSSRRA